MNALAYSVPTAAKATGLSTQHLRDAIHAGQLRARWSGGIDADTGKGLGKYVIRAEDLQAYLDSLVEA